MCVWTKKRGSMNAVVLMATPCPKSLLAEGENAALDQASPCALVFCIDLRGFLMMMMF